MARTRSTRTAATTTVTHDAVDELVAKLNTIEGIEFAKDAWVNKAPAVYGVVELSSEARQMWADGHLTDSAWNVIVTAYVSDDSNEWWTDPRYPIWVRLPHLTEQHLPRWQIFGSLPDRDRYRRQWHSRPAADDRIPGILLHL